MLRELTILRSSTEHVRFKAWFRAYGIRATVRTMIRLPRKDFSPSGIVTEAKPIYKTITDAMARGTLHEASEANKKGDYKDIVKDHEVKEITELISKQDLS